MLLFAQPGRHLLAVSLRATFIQFCDDRHAVFGGNQVGGACKILAPVKGTARHHPAQQMPVRQQKFLGTGRHFPVTEGVGEQQKRTRWSLLAQIEQLHTAAVLRQALGETPHVARHRVVNK